MKIAAMVFAAAIVPVSAAETLPDLTKSQTEAIVMLGETAAAAVACPDYYIVDRRQSRSCAK